MKDVGGKGEGGVEMVVIPVNTCLNVSRASPGGCIDVSLSDLIF